MFDLDLDIFNFFQDAKIRSNANTADMAKNKAYDTSADMRELEVRYERLRVLTLSMWQLLKNHTGLMDSDLKKVIFELDAADGHIDGKVKLKSKSLTCPGCNRSIKDHCMVCPFCGLRNSKYKPFKDT